MTFKTGISSVSYFPDPASLLLPDPLGLDAQGNQLTETAAASAERLDLLISAFRGLKGLSGTAAVAMFGHEAGLWRLHTAQTVYAEQLGDAKIITVEGEPRLAFHNGTDFVLSKKPWELQFGNILDRISSLEQAVTDGSGGDLTSSALALAVETLRNELLGGASADGDTLGELLNRIASLELGLTNSLDQAALATAISGILGGVDESGDTLGKLAARLLVVETAAATPPAPIDPSLSIFSGSIVAPTELWGGSANVSVSSASDPSGAGAVKIVMNADGNRGGLSIAALTVSDQNAVLEMEIFKPASSSGLANFMAMSTSFTEATGNENSAFMRFPDHPAATNFSDMPADEWVRVQFDMTEAAFAPTELWRFGLVAKTGLASAAEAYLRHIAVFPIAKWTGDTQQNGGGGTSSASLNFASLPVLSSLVGGDRALVLDANKNPRGIAPFNIITSPGAATTTADGMTYIDFATGTDQSTREANKTKWNVLAAQFHKDSSLGKAGLMIPPGQWSCATGLNIEHNMVVRGHSAFQSMLFFDDTNDHCIRNISDGVAPSTATNINGAVFEHFGIRQFAGGAGYQANNHGFCIDNTRQNIQNTAFPTTSVDAMNHIHKLFVLGPKGDGIRIRGRGENRVLDNFVTTVWGNGLNMSNTFDSWAINNTGVSTGKHGFYANMTESRLTNNKMFYCGRQVLDNSDDLHSMFYGMYLDGHQITAMGNSVQECAGGLHIKGRNSQILGMMIDCVGKDHASYTPHNGPWPDLAALGIPGVYLVAEDLEATNVQGHFANFQGWIAGKYLNDHYIHLENSVMADCSFDFRKENRVDQIAAGGNQSISVDTTWPYAETIQGAPVVNNGSGAEVLINGSRYYDGLDNLTLADLANVSHGANHARKDCRKVRRISNNGRLVIPAGYLPTDVWRYVDDGSVAATPQ